MSRDLGAMVRTALDGSVDDATHVHGRERVLACVSPAGSARRARSWLALMVATLLASCLLWALWPSATIELASSNGGQITIDDGGARVETLAEPSSLHFSDGSTIELAPRSLARVGDLSKHGARVVLASGRAHLTIQHRRGTSWSVEAGPYVVRVTGTEFEVSWDPASGAFGVAMVEGSVLVEGTPARAPVPLRAGQRLEVSQGVLRVGDQVAPLAGADLPSAEPHVASSAPTQSAAPPLASAQVAAPGHKPRVATWAELVAQGRYKDVVEQARARGMLQVAESASSAELSALADAARYAKDGAAARAALEALRQRFASSSAGKNAVFLLGRLAEDSDNDAARAIALYDEYLALGGSYASEALGRKMSALRRTQGNAAAKPAAELYLKRHPEGAYAAAAKSILETP